MRYTFLFGLFLIWHVSLKAQTLGQDSIINNLNQKHNELTIGLCKLLIHQDFELGYEHSLSKNFSIGSHLAYADRTRLYKYFATIYGRFYPSYGQKLSMEKFFLQIYPYYMQKWNQVTIEHKYYTDIQNTLRKIGGLGFALGSKFTNHQGWSLQILAGIGRDFISFEQLSVLSPRFEVFLGYRF